MIALVGLAASIVTVAVVLRHAAEADAATRVTCGQIVTRSIVVANNLVNCPEDGLRIGAPGITVDLNGHTLDGTDNGGTVTSGVVVNDHRRVVIKHGTVTDFGSGVFLVHDADLSVVKRIRSFGNTGSGIEISADRTTVTHNTVFSNSRTDGNTVEGIRIAHESNRNAVTDNAVRSNTGFGILLSQSSVGSSLDRNLIARNEVIGNGRGGIVLSGTVRGTKVRGNVANANVGDGIDTTFDPRATLAGNTANLNVALGIDAHPGVINGGGNRARGNGNPLQCRNIACHVPSAAALTPAAAATSNSVPRTAVQRIVFAAGTGTPNQSDIAEIGPGGGGFQRLTDAPITDLGPAVSPRGSRIAFSRTVSGAGFDIFVMRADGSQLRPVFGTAGSEGGASFSPNGERIAFSSDMDGDFEIYTIRLDGTDIRQLTENDDDDSFADWSPRGRRIAFITNRDGNFEIYTMRPDGTEQRNSTEANGIDMDPAWSPDGRSLAFSRLPPGEIRPDLFRMRADGSGRLNLTRTPDARERSPAWSPNGRRIAFDRDLRIFKMESDGTGITPVTSPEMVTAQNPDWAVLRR
jgi:parallel beta-helix repeat protein